MNERYRMTEHGIAVHECYTVTLISAREAIEMAHWLLWHYVELEMMRRSQVDTQKKEAEHGHANS